MKATNNNFRQRLALQIGKAAKSPFGDNKDSMGASFPYGFERYAKVASSLQNKRLNWDWR